MRIHIDIESRSAVDLRKTGVYVYAESPTTDVWCVAYSINEAYSINDRPIQVWRPSDGFGCPSAIYLPIQAGIATVHAWNANFERVMWQEILAKRYGWPQIPLESWRCTMAAALAMGFPAALERAAPAIGLDIAKDAQGQGLMKRMARPRKIINHAGARTYTNDTGGVCPATAFDQIEYVWWDEPEKIERLIEYCKQDVEVERQIHKRLCPLVPDEQELWFLDQQINDRGVHIDRALCEAANKIRETAATRINDGLVEATGGRVTKRTQVIQLKEFCTENGVETDTLRKNDVIELLAQDDLPSAVREALELRQQGGKTSINKIDSALRGLSADGRARGLFFFNGATTGRWAGRRLQLQNLQRPEGKFDDEQILADVLTGHYDTVEMLHGSPLTAIGNIIRGIITAAPGNDLIWADFSNIESRVLAWLAGEEHALASFRAGLDVYKVAYGSAFGIPPQEVTEGQRQIGKVIVLALGFGGGVGAFLSAAKIYQVDIGKSYDLLCKTAPDAAERAMKAYDDRGKGSGTPKETWVAAEIVKIGWRDAHPNIVKFWGDLEKAAFDVLSNPGTKVSVGKLCFLKAGSFMWLQLPSGRPLCYPYPRITEAERPWIDKKTGKKATGPTFTYKAELTQPLRWADSYARGSLFAENVTQAVARDLLAEAMKRLESAGYPVVMHAHDEAVAEVPQGFGDVESFCTVTSDMPPWATGCPISAKGHRAARYKKA